MSGALASRPAGQPDSNPTDALRGLFVQAAKRCGVVERRYRIAGSEVAVRFAGPAMLDRIGGSFEHLSSESGDAPALTINVWDSESSGGEAPAIVGSEFADDGTGPIYYYENADVRALGRWRTLTAYDSSAAEGWFWAPGAGEMLSWDWASPLRAILHWWLGRRGVLQVHGGAVGFADGGVVIVGRGGSGKSTTSLTSLLAGLAYAGDDFVALEDGDSPYVHSLYSSGKLESHQMERFPSLAPAVANPDRLPGEKAVVYARDVEGATTTSGFPLRAVLVPRIKGGVETRLEPASPAAALVALAPSTIFQLHPPQPDALAAMAAIVRRVPCFSLELGTDLDRIPQAIASFLRGG
jgi:hypothetical protein